MADKVSARREKYKGKNLFFALHFRCFISSVGDASRVGIACDLWESQFIPGDADAGRVAHRIDEE